VRLVQVTVPAGKRQALLDALDDEGIDYVVTEETSGREYTAVVHFPLPTDAVEPVLERLREVGLDDQAYTVVLDAETVISRRFDQLKERYEEEEETGERIAREEITARAQDLAPSTTTYVVMTVVSAVIATAGLLLDSPAVVVGSMVIAPLIGPAMAAAVGTVTDDADMFARGAKLQVVGFALAIASAAAFAFLVKELHLVQVARADVPAIGQIRERLAPDFLSLAVALGAGVAGAFSLSSGVSASLVGVMIAVALIPPAATVGIGLAWWLPGVVVGSSVLVLVNALSINLAALATFWYQGYRPERWFRLDEARATTAKRIVVLAVAIAVLSVFLGGVTYDSFRNAQTEEAVREAVAGVADDAGVAVLDVDVEFSGGALFRQPSEVVVTLGVESRPPPDGLATRIDDRVDRIAGRDLAVEVRYLTIDRA